MTVDLFPTLCKVHGIPEPQCEFRFLKDRKFRFDYAWPEAMLAIEKNGAIWKKGGHSSGLGLLRDYEKLNLGQLAGWTILQYTPQQLTSEATLKTLKTVLAVKA